MWEKLENNCKCSERCKPFIETKRQREIESQSVESPTSTAVALPPCARERRRAAQACVKRASHWDRSSVENAHRCDLQAVSSRQDARQSVPSIGVLVHSDLKGPSVAERTNRTLADGVTAMLAESGLPQMFWVEAVLSLVHVLNRSFTSACPDATPYEL